MAVMTSVPSDGVELEQKTQPVPSSEKMALDLDINGTSNHDEMARENSLPEDSLPTKLVASRSESDADVAMNAAAVAANCVEDSLDLPDAPLESEEFERDEDELSLLAPINDEADASSSPHKTNLVTTSINTEPIPSPLQQQPSLKEDLADPPTELLQAPSSVPHTAQPHETAVRDRDPTPVQIEAVAMLPADEDFRKNAVSPQDSSLGASASTAVRANERDESIPSLPASLDDHPLHPASVSNLDLNQNSQIDVVMNDSDPSPSMQDTNMMDAPASPSKVSHSRDEDADGGRSAKRAKTETDASMAVDVVPPAEIPVSLNGDAVAAPGDELRPTPYQQKELLKATKIMKNTNNGKGFAKAVIELWPALRDGYLERVPHPMDLSIIEARLKEGYPTMSAFKRDVSLIYENAVLFNGLTHDVTAQGKAVRDHLLAKIPGPEPIKIERKRKETPAVDPTPRVAPARRQSRGLAATVTSPTTPVQTFALDPSGTPLIRRDSTKGEGGRPKREIHPPKSKDLIYSARPKKKKFAIELKFCDEVLNELRKPRHHAIAQPFMVPVDPVALGIPDYFKLIKTPMDLSTVGTRLQSGQYENAKDFETDIRQIFKNCYKFNPVDSFVHKLGKDLEAVFDQQWSRRAQWIADHTTSNAASPTSTVESEEEESEEEPEEVATSLHDRLIEEQHKLIVIMGAKRQDPALIRMQQDMVAIVQKQVDESAKREKDKEKSKAKTKPKPTKRAPAASKKKAESSKRAYKAKNIGIVEKEQISAGIVQLEGRLLDQAVGFLKIDYPNLNLDDETELDIDQFSDLTLSKLHDLIIKNVPGIVPAKPEPVRAPKPTRPKKNKPMSKNEQESKIAKLAQLKQQLEYPQGSPSDDAGGNVVVPSVAVEQDQSSGDDSPSDSEED